jgi:hypothetical protein
MKNVYSLASGKTFFIAKPEVRKQKAGIESPRTFSCPSRELTSSLLECSGECIRVVRGADGCVHREVGVEQNRYHAIDSTCPYLLARELLEVKRDVTRPGGW